MSDDTSSPTPAQAEPGPQLEIRCNSGNCYVRWQDWNWQRDMAATHAILLEIENCRLRRKMRFHRITFSILWGFLVLNAIARWIVFR